MQTRCGGDLLQIATGRFREAAESTATNRTAGRNRKVLSANLGGTLFLFAVGRTLVHEAFAAVGARQTSTAQVILREKIASGVQAPTRRRS